MVSATTDETAKGKCMNHKLAVFAIFMISGFFLGQPMAFVFPMSLVIAAFIGEQP